MEAHKDIAKEEIAHECVLLGEFGLWIQALLGFLCLSTLVLKRYRERPRRQWGVFLLDSSKQLTGSTTVHILNLAFATLLSGLDRGDSCNWYWINIVIDCTLGVLVLYLYLRQAKKLLGLEGPTEFGFYGDPPRLSVWIKQMVIWQVLVCTMKLTMVLIMILCHVPLKLLAKLVLTIFDHFPHYKLVVVMVVTPFIMNTLQFWLIDNFIQRQQTQRESARTVVGGSRVLPTIIGDPGSDVFDKERDAFV